MEFLNKNPPLKLVLMILPGLLGITVGRIILEVLTLTPTREVFGWTFFLLGWAYLLALLAYMLIVRKITQKKRELQALEGNVRKQA